MRACLITSTGSNSNDFNFPICLQYCGNRGGDGENGSLGSRSRVDTAVCVSVIMRVVVTLLYVRSIFFLMLGVFIRCECII